MLSIIKKNPHLKQRRTTRLYKIWISSKRDPATLQWNGASATHVSPQSNQTSTTLRWSSRRCVRHGGRAREQWADCDRACDVAPIPRWLSGPGPRERTPSFSRVLFEGVTDKALNKWYHCLILLGAQLFWVNLRLFCLINLNK